MDLRLVDDDRLRDLPRRAGEVLLRGRPSGLDAASLEAEEMGRLLWNETRGLEVDTGDDCAGGEVSWVAVFDGVCVEVDVDWAGDDRETLDIDGEEVVGESRSRDIFAAIRGLGTAEGFWLADRL